MPLFIHNENEVYNEDDGPLAANTPSTGSIGSRGARVVACGHKVLEVLERHKNEVQSRMADREMEFRRMLQKSKQLNPPELRPSNERQHKSARIMPPSEVIAPLPNQAGNYSNEPELHPNRIDSRKTIRGSTAPPSRRPSHGTNLPMSESDEYLDLPEVVPWIIRNGASSTSSTHNKSNSSNTRRQSNLILRNSSRGSFRNPNSSSSRGSVTFADPTTEADPCCNSFPSTSTAYDVWDGREENLEYTRDSENNVPFPPDHRSSQNTSRHSIRRDETQNAISDQNYGYLSNTHIPLTSSRKEILNSGVSDTSKSDLHWNNHDTSKESIRGRAFPGPHVDHSLSFTAASVGNTLSTMSTSTLRRVVSTSSSQDSSVETIQSTRTVIPAPTNRTQLNRRNITDYIREYMWRICVVVVVVLLLFGLLFLSMDAWKNSASSLSRSQNVKAREKYYGIIM